MKITALSITFLLNYLFILSCNTGDSKGENSSIKQWIIKNREQLNLASDSIIKDYNQRNKADSNWIAVRLAITRYMPGLVGTLVEQAADSTDCIVIEIEFFKDQNRKKKILFAAVDSTCLNILNHITLETDSTDTFIFGKNGHPFN